MIQANFYRRQEAKLDHYSKKGKKKLLTQFGTNIKKINSDQIWFYNYSRFSSKPKEIVIPTSIEGSFIFEHSMSLFNQSLFKVFELILNQIYTKNYSHDKFSNTFFCNILAALPLPQHIKLKLRELFFHKKEFFFMTKYYAKIINEDKLTFYSPYLKQPIFVFFTKMFWEIVINICFEMDKTKTPIQVHSYLFHKALSIIFENYNITSLSKKYSYSPHCSLAVRMDNFTNYEDLLHFDHFPNDPYCSEIKINYS